MMKQFAKLGFILAAFAAVACVGLAFVDGATREQIKVNADKQLNESLRGLFAEADEFLPAELASPDQAVSLEAAYVAKRGGAPLGIAVKASGASYGGVSILLVGVGLDRRLVGARVLENKDTPGLGANAASQSYFVDKPAKLTFTGQFVGKPISDAFEVKKDVQAITASTITSKALARIVKAASAAAGTWLERVATGVAGGN
jgi:electron transport complex protein RnfG